MAGRCRLRGFDAVLSDDTIDVVHVCTPNHLNLARGLEVQVVYEGGKPQTARVLLWKHMMGPAVYMLLIAVAFAGAGVLIALKN